MKVAIIGAGNSGCAHAAKLIENGHVVSLIKSSHSMHDENFKEVLRTKQIKCIDTPENKVFVANLSTVTRDFEEGLNGAEVVMILTQSLQHRDLCHKVSPLLQDGQIVFLIPGNLGSIAFANSLEKGKRVIFAEGESTPFDARIESPGVVKILFKNVRNAVSFLYKEDERNLGKIDGLFNTHKYLRSSVVESTMHNPNLVVHTIGAIMSASRIELTNGEFWMYKEAFSKSIWNLINSLDKEKNDIINAFGGSTSSYIDQCKWRNENDLSVDSMTVFKSYAANGGPKGPSSVHTRYIYEDVPMELGVLEMLGQYLGVPTPTTSALITIASVLTQTNYRDITYKLDDIKKHIDRIRKENNA